MAGKIRKFFKRAGLTVGALLVIGIAFGLLSIIAFARVPDNVAIGNVEAAGHLNRADIARARNSQRLVGHQRELHLRAVGGAVEDLLDHPRAGVGVYPEPGLGHDIKGGRIRVVHILMAWHT